MRLSELIPSSSSADVEITGLASHSGDVRPGYLFAALAGTRATGVDFIPEALARGAVAVLAPEGTDPALAPGVSLVTDPNPQQRLAIAAARYHGAQPAVVVCVTGTNGKTSVADFTRQIWQTPGRKAASLGTLGVCVEDEWRPLPLTTPDPIALHRVLAELAIDGIDHLALEASSHGLAQYRLDGVRVAAAAFTNVTRDHMDYHADSDAYFAAKAGLFERVMGADGTAVLNADDGRVAGLAKRCRALGQNVLTFGAHGTDLRLLARRDTEWGQDLRVAVDGAVHAIALPLPGAFQAYNALAAVGPGARDWCGRGGCRRRAPQRERRAGQAATGCGPSSRRRDFRGLRAHAGRAGCSAQRPAAAGGRKRWSWSSAVAASGMSASGAKWAKSPRASPTRRS